MIATGACQYRDRSSWPSVFPRRRLVPVRVRICLVQGWCRENAGQPRARWMTTRSCATSRCGIFTVEFSSGAGSVRALDNVSLDIRPGETFGIVGRSERRQIARSFVRWLTLSRNRAGSRAAGSRSPARICFRSIRQDCAGCEAGISGSSAECQKSSEPRAFGGQADRQCLSRPPQSDAAEAWDRGLEMLRSVGIPARGAHARISARVVGRYWSSGSSLPWPSSVGRAWCLRTSRPAAWTSRSKTRYCACSGIWSPVRAPRRSW